MIKKLVRHGDDLALVISQRLMRSLGWKQDADVQVSTDGTRILVTPVVKGQRKDVPSPLRNRISRRKI